jgi:hypothetical protein
MGGGCFCGCKRYERRAEPKPPGDAPVERLTAFMYQHLSSEECSRLIRHIAKRRRVTPPPALHDARQGFIIENLTRAETTWYLEDLKRRQFEGRALVDD